MKRRSLSTAALLATLATAVVASEGVPYQRVADMLHLVLSADREVYTRKVVQRLTVDEEVLTASEHYDDDLALPLPSQMFRFGAERVMDETDEFSYSLLSLAPINKKNGPGTPLEKEGLKFVADNPGGELLRRRGSRRHQVLYGRVRRFRRRRCLRDLPQQPQGLAATRLRGRRGHGRRCHSDFDGLTAPLFPTFRRASISGFGG